MRKFLFVSTLALLLVSASLAQETPGPRIEITGVNPGGLPRVGVMVNAFDNLGQPLPNLTAEDIRVTGELAPHARVSSVVSFSDPEAVPISAMLVIDVSTSMAGEPIEEAKQAAAAFVNAMAADDPVAVLTFSSRVNLVQGFTTDRENLLAIIDGLAYGGKTLLYDATLQAIELTAAIDNPRRAIILLSDGVHYDDLERSRVDRAQANRTAVVRGVPVYTIGLGYGADRTYLEQISTDTNAFFSESPSPQELNDIYTGLADLLRTQYDITLDVDVPLDGRVWQLELEVDTPWGAVRSSGRLRAPVPVPVFNFEPVDQPVSEPLEIMPEIVADDGIAGVAVAMDDERPETVVGPPFTVLVDPVTLSPGDHRLTFSATDRDGDSGSATLEFNVAALPPEIRLDPVPGGELDEAQTYTLEVGGQTPLDSATWRLDDGSALPLDAALEFTIDPNILEPGEHSLQLEVTNTGGVTSRPDYSFTVPPLPIRFEIEGLEEGDLLEDSAEIGVSVQSSQFPVTAVEYALNDVTLPDVDDRISLHAAELVPGAARLEVRVSSAGGQVETDSLGFEVARLPIRFEIEGLEEGDLLEDSAEIGVSVLSSQFPITDVDYALNGVLLPDVDNRISLHAAELVPGPARLDVRVSSAGGQVETDTLEFEVARLPLEIELEDLPPGTSIDRDVDLGVAVSGQGSDFELEVLLDGEPLVLTEASIPLEILQLAPGQHSLVIRARDELGNVGEESFNFSVSPGPAQTATQALAYRQATQASIQRRATSAARSTQVASQNRARASATIAARATSTQAAALQMATAAAEATAIAQATGTQTAIEGQATASARSTALVQRNRERIAATTAARATSTQIAEEQLATRVAEATATQIAVQQRATLDAQASAVAQATGTQVVVQRQATVAARSTAFAQSNRERVTATLAARATSTQVAEEQLATKVAEATATQVATQRIATATRAAEATGTQVAIATATRAAEATATQVAAQRIATATRAAEATATQVATQRIATATRAAEATATQVATQQIATATGAAEATATQAAAQQIATATRAAEATATQVATQRIATATSAAEATATQVATQRIATATRAAEATATQVATQRIATATSAAEATATQVATQRIATATSAAEATATQVATQRIATATSAAEATATQVATQRIATATSAAEATATQVATQRIATATSARRGHRHPGRHATHRHRHTRRRSHRHPGRHATASPPPPAPPKPPPPRSPRNRSPPPPAPLKPPPPRSPRSASPPPHAPPRRPLPRPPRSKLPRLPRPPYCAAPHWRPLSMRPPALVWRQGPGPRNGWRPLQRPSPRRRWQK